MCAAGMCLKDGLGARCDRLQHSLTLHTHAQTRAPTHTYIHTHRHSNLHTHTHKYIVGEVEMCLKERLRAQCEWLPRYLILNTH